MAQLPKIVLQRLQRDTQSHPDADLLNAFMENMVNQRERGQILDHLAACRDCREIVALSQPEHIDSEFARTHSGTTAWISWPVLRWAGVAACVVVVGTAITLHYESRSRTRELTAAEQEGVNFENKVAQPPLPAPQMTQGENKSSGLRSSNRNALSAGPRKVIPPLPTARPNAAQMQAAINSDGKSTLDLQGSDTLEARARAEAAPTPNSAVKEMNVPGRAKDDSGGASAKESGIGGGLLVSRKTAAATLALNAGLPISAARIVPKWTLSSEGILQRSLDQGQTWETIPVDGHATFRALAANLFDIWVGGSNGSLYHSSDAGEHWTQVRPTLNGEGLSADIIGVEFADSQHGKISTSAHETWTTDDGGQTWQKK